MSGPSVRCPEDAALFDRADYLCCIKDQSSTNSHDQTFRPQRSAHQMGHAVVTIRYAFSVPEGHKGTSHCGPPRRESNIEIRHPLRRTTNETAEVHSSQVHPTVWQIYFDGASRTIPRAGLVAGIGVVFI